ncbi:MAG: imidazolonepropionase [Candidatus Wallbacteria bacterium]|nr:imidazolonepropionase [Candidatus Wallbacteria bacterium]
MYLIRNANQILTMSDLTLGVRSGVSLLCSDTIIALDQDSVIERLIYEKYRDQPVTVYDAAGCIVMPGFIDSHTHLVFAGSREHEFRMRLTGKTYLEILSAGGGILSSVEATRKAPEDLLLELAKNRLRIMLHYGTTTVEAKSGYGLDLETELKMLRVAKKLSRYQPVDLISTFLGAHALPREYSGNKDKFLSYLLSEVLPAVKSESLADYCDIFCEKGVFEIEETRAYLTQAQKMGFKLKMHADEIHDIGGARLAAELGAVSADHLGAVSDDGIAALCSSGTVAVLLPVTLFYLMSKAYAPARKILDAGVPVAIATDFNPGSSFCESMQTAITLSLLQMKLTPEEALFASTRGGAQALELTDRGEISIGKLSDLLVINADNYLHFAHHIGVNQVKAVFKRGALVFEDSH